MTLTVATQYEFTGTYQLKVGSRGRMTLPRDILKGLEERVRAQVLGNPELEMNPYGVKYKGHWLYVTQEDRAGRRRIKEIVEQIQQEDPEAPEILYKNALLQRNMLINVAEEAKDIVTRHWRFYGEEKAEYTTMHLALDVRMEEIRKQGERASESERVRENVYCGTQRYSLDDQGRICFGKDHEITRNAGDGKIVMLGMQDMLVLMTPAQREALQKAEPKFLRERQVIQLVRS